MVSWPSLPFTIRRVGEPNRLQPRSPLDGLAERLLLPRARWSGYVFGAATVALATLILGPVMELTRLANSSAVYTIPVLLTAALYGRGSALATSVATFVAYDLFFVDPSYPHSLARPREWLTQLVFVVTALVAGQLAAMLRQQAAPGYYTTRHAELATMFAQQAAVAIEHARLYEQVRDKAALEERQRLARELHDSVSQALYGILLNASTADELFETAPGQAHGRSIPGRLVVSRVDRGDG